jgi:hypothetical protein
VSRGVAEPEMEAHGGGVPARGLLLIPAHWSETPLMIAVMAMLLPLN